MKYALVMLFCVLARAACADDAPRTHFREAARAYAAQDYSNAATGFASAAEQAPAERLDPAIARYNEGNALLRSGNAADASRRYQDALRTRDLALQQRAAYNRGNALLDLAGELEHSKELQGAAQAVDEALGMYELSMTLDPKDPDPKVNHELAALEQQRLQELLRQQQQSAPPPSQGEQKNEGQQSKGDGQQQAQGQPGQAQQGDQQEKQEPSSEPGQEPQSQKGQAGEQQPSSGDEDAAGQQAQPAEDMTREEATLLLDAARQQEQAAREQLARERLKQDAGRLPPVEKDW